MSTYDQFAGFAQTWGLLYFFLIFTGVVIYALWPRNRKTFEAAARIPLSED
ncbi:cbb3-type cytochrome c oxidase subunit 3 [Methylobrevis pamukkalensis]|uniref:Cbb3-type cytochrome oxidase component FixQ n=1 Tax=Methylobrevis pamukkalensis TaxID=1439726 RepID=A0A1E3H7Q8_9HYPH|nr:cbb3-type cytochrome c oxidase subunit 3 [Methylobrevis pamukkalensis]ODN72353.1 Cbb3-type cytochrome oxidase component FixQ [Methylobrevis pamukkalensis]